MSRLLVAHDLMLDDEALDARLQTYRGAIASFWRAERRTVAVLATSSGYALVLELATALSGAPLVPLNWHLTAHELRFLIERADVGLLFAPSERASVVEEATRDLDRPPEVVHWGTTSLDTWAAGRDTDPGSEVRMRPPRVFTSGTTGTPSLVELPPLTFRAGFRPAEFVAAARGNRFAQFGTHLVAGPLYHVGPMNSALTLLAARKPVILPERFDAARTLETIESERVETTLMVPTHFIRLLAAREAVDRRHDTSSLQLVVHTGSGCPVEVKERMLEWWGDVFLEIYGATESGGVCAIDSAEWRGHRGSVGRPVPGYEVLVVDAEGRPMPKGDEGRLYFRDSSGRGIRYEDDPEKTQAALLEPGTFTLGEIGYVDVEGYVYITDRQSDMVVSGGVNLYPAEAERVLQRHPAVADVAVIGMPHPEMGEELHAVVVPVDRAAPSAAELLAYCLEHIASLKCPRSVHFVPTLGRSPMGKVNKKTLARSLQPTST